MNWRTPLLFRVETVLCYEKIFYTFVHRASGACFNTYCAKLQLSHGSCIIVCKIYVHVRARRPMYTSTLQKCVTALHVTTCYTCDVKVDCVDVS